MSEDQLQSRTPGARRPGPRRLAPKLSCLTCGPLTLDLDTMYVTKGGVSVKLTPKECQLLTAFMSHPGQVLPRELLIKEIWHTDYTGDMRMLHVHIRWLRVKIEDDPGHPRLVQTVRGRGYRFVPPEATEI
jgi:DNA-binding response OmpR family regulator